MPIGIGETYDLFKKQIAVLTFRCDIGFCMVISEHKKAQKIKVFKCKVKHLTAGQAVW